MERKTYRIVGRVINLDDQRGIPGLRVEAWDKDLIFHDLVGSTVTGHQGSFGMVFDDSAFRELFFDRHPDLFFKVFKGPRLLKSTKDSVLWNVTAGKTEVVIEVDLIRKPREEPVFPDPDKWPERQPEGEVPGERRYPPEPGEWKDKIREWWEKRQKEHDEERDKEDRERRPMPRPYLYILANYMWGDFSRLQVDEPGTVGFVVWNEGSFPAWNCYVQVFEGPPSYSHPLSDYELRGQRIITLQPGELREVSLPWVRRRSTGSIVGVCFDPLLDPRDFTLVDLTNRHINIGQYTNVE